MLMVLTFTKKFKMLIEEGMQVTPFPCPTPRYQDGERLTRTVLLVLGHLFQLLQMVTLYDC